MPDSSGYYELVGNGSTVEAQAAIDQFATGAVQYGITGGMGVFDIASALGTEVVLNQTTDATETLNLQTGAGVIMMGGGMLSDVVNVTVDGGGSYVSGYDGLAQLNEVGALAFGAGGGTLVVGSLGQFAAVSALAGITGWSAGDMIDDWSLNPEGIIGYTVSPSPGGLETVEILDRSGDFSFALDGADLPTGSYTSLTDGPLVIAADHEGGTLISAVCFLAGSRIATPHGEAAVETLRPGDLVATLAGGETAFKPVVWIGRRALDVRSAGPDAKPVRIRAHAFASGAPRRDLLVTGEHCVLVDGRLIPARMLVNGGSIVLDESIRSYEFFHVELERHSILLSEGLPTESYLDTGNRAIFSNATAAWLRPDLSVGPSASAWATRAAAPLAVDRATVEPIWRRLAERARSMGLAPVAPAALTGEPDLRVLTEAGVAIRAGLSEGGRHAFVVPAGGGSLRLLSRAARPSDAIGPYVDDRRALGVLVGRISLGVGRRRRTVQPAACPGPLAGWHATEGGSPHRWTDGDAALPIDLSAWSRTPVLLDVEVIRAGPYPAEPAPVAGAAALAA